MCRLLYMVSFNVPKRYETKRSLLRPLELCDKLITKIGQLFIFLSLEIQGCLGRFQLAFALCELALHGKQLLLVRSLDAGNFNVRSTKKLGC